MRTPIIAGNWKMNKTGKEGAALVSELIPLVKDAKCEVVVCVPYTALEKVADALKGSNIKLGAENVHWEKSGAFTGEISVDMLKEIGVEYVIIGHSERRQYFGETDETVNKRTIAALNGGLKAIVCVGETLEEREGNVTENVVEKQIKEGLANISAEQMDNVIIAYEPVWAIGTGRTATNEQANETIGYIRKVVSNVFGKEVADKVRIQYGGSMNPQNATELMAMSEIDGGLIGGASLLADKFSQVVNY